MIFQHFICPICNGCFQSIEELYDHSEDHIDQRKWIEKCKFCPFIGPQNLVSQHEKSEHEKPVKTKSQFKCKIRMCKFETSLLIKMKDHKTLAHNFCPQCDFVAPSMNELLNHQDSKHKTNKILKRCRFCDYVARNSQVNMHESVKHMKKGEIEEKLQKLNEKLEKIEKSEKFGKSEKFEKSEKVVKSEKFEKSDKFEKSETPEKSEIVVNKCEFCGYTSEHVGNFKYHKQIKHFACPECPRVCESLKLLYDHQNSKHQNMANTLKLQKCQNCELIRRISYIELHQKKCKPSRKSDIKESNIPENRKKSDVEKPIIEKPNFVKSNLVKSIKENSNIDNNRKAIIDIKTETSEQGHDCDMCDFNVEKISTLKFHRIRKHNACARCPKVFPTLENLMEHQMKDHDYCTQYLMQKCRFCKLITKALLMEKHEQFVHKEELEKEKSTKQNKLKCKVCDLSFSDSKKMSTHFINFHLQKKNPGNSDNQEIFENPKKAENFRKSEKFEKTKNFENSENSENVKKPKNFENCDNVKKPKNIDKPESLKISENSDNPKIIAVKNPVKISLLNPKRKIKTEPIDNDEPPTKVTKTNDDNQADLLFQCSLCKQKFAEVSQLAEHVETHKVKVKTEPIDETPETPMEIDTNNIVVKEEIIEEKSKNPKKSEITKKSDISGWNSGSKNCPFCPYKTPKIESIIRHLQLSHNQCPDQECKQICKNLSELLLHQTLEHGKTAVNPLRKCQFCGYIAREKIVDVHEERVHQKPQVDFKNCDKCDVKFSDPDARVRHLASKQYKNNEKFYCDLCPYKSCTMPNLKIHRENIHKDAKNMKKPIL